MNEKFLPYEEQEIAFISQKRQEFSALDEKKRKMLNKILAELKKI